MVCFALPQQFIRHRRIIKQKLIKLFRSKWVAYLHLAVLWKRDVALSTPVSVTVSKRLMRLSLRAGHSPKRSVKLFRFCYRCSASLKLYQPSPFLTATANSAAIIFLFRTANRYSPIKGTFTGCLLKCEHAFVLRFADFLIFFCTGNCRSLKQNPNGW
jgi:hypothetical protein